MDWVKFDADLARDGSVEPTDKALYAAIASFVDADTRESPDTVDVDLNVIPLDVPTRKRLAACIGKSLDTVDRATKRLEDRGLLKVHRQADPSNPRLSIPSEYELLDHELWDQKAADRAAARAARRSSTGEGGGRMGAATPSRMGAAGGGRMGAAVEEEREVKEENAGEIAALPRSGDVRRTSTSGSRGPSKGGCAASGNSKPSRLTREQRQQVQDVRALLPADLNQALGDKTPLNTAAAIVAALAAGEPRERTPQQLVEHRVVVRWNGHWATRFYAGELPKQPFGPLEAMLRDTQECSSGACEDRADIFTGEACPACAMRTADKRADREAAREHPPVSEPAASVPGQRPRVVVDHTMGLAPECTNDLCGRPLPAGSTATVCVTCREGALA
ncbi:hypothetical protein ACFQ6Q_00575 [Streptomyces sp. NPDC056437]|uniref:hypothetical protein n=1 Tax=Streptomyces sp. NPDC056437 TaxID=3345816 RepID=UPI0036CAB007